MQCCICYLGQTRISELYMSFKLVAHVAPCTLLPFEWLVWSFLYIAEGFGVRRRLILYHFFSPLVSLEFGISRGLRVDWFSPR